MKKDLLKLSIIELSELLRTEKVSPVELVHLCLANIEKYKAQTNAFITVMKDKAIADAKFAEIDIAAGNWKGLLHGIPVAVKDFYDTEGIRTTAASERLKDRIPKKDAEVVKLLKQAGAILMGKTNMDELGMGTTSLTGFFGQVHNPLFPGYVAGGSSGGSAAAIASGMCLATVDTDAIGSCRLPSACCGITGFKVTNGTINMTGILEGEKADPAIVQLSAVGISTRYAEDTIEVFKSMIHKEKEITTLKALNIGLVQNFKSVASKKSWFSEVTKLFTNSKHNLVEVEVPFETAVFDLKNIESDRKKIDELLFNHADLLVLPTLSGPIPSIEEATQKGPQAVDPANTFFCNYYGLPALSIRGGTDPTGLPFGVQIVGKPGDDLLVLQLGMWLQTKQVSI